MVASEKQMVTIFVDRACPERWIVRDAEGNFWLVPPTAHPWDHASPSNSRRRWNWTRARTLPVLARHSGLIHLYQRANPAASSRVPTISRIP
jgi:hypothetical protein